MKHTLYEHGWQKDHRQILGSKHDPVANIIFRPIAALLRVYI